MNILGLLVLSENVALSSVQSRGIPSVQSGVQGNRTPLVSSTNPRDLNIGVSNVFGNGWPAQEPSVLSSLQSNVTGNGGHVGSLSFNLV